MKKRPEKPTTKECCDLILNKLREKTTPSERSMPRTYLPSAFWYIDDLRKKGRLSRIDFKG